MSKLELFVIKENVYVPHPYEPQRCKEVICDICLILDTDVTTYDDFFDLTTSYLLHQHSISYFIERGCLFVKVFHDNHLNCFSSLFNFYFDYECKSFPYSQALDLISSYVSDKGLNIKKIRSKFYDCKSFRYS